jgi:hypothetical protein
VTEPNDRNRKPLSGIDDLSSVANMVLPPIELEIPMPPVEPPRRDEPGPAETDKGSEPDRK